MMKLLGKWLVCGLLVMAGEGVAQQIKPPKIPAEALQVAKSTNAFALEFYKEMPTEDNFSFSPYSISSAFAMVYNGSKGSTQKEISTIFHYPTSIEEMNKGWEWLNKYFTFYPSNASEDVRLSAANSLWVQSNFPILPSFRDAMGKYFKGAFRFVDFKAQTETSRATINAWVKQNTFGKIVDILSSEAIDSSTRMILISALYMKAKWKNPFDSRLTHQQPFFTQDGNVQTVLSMTQTAYFPYGDTPEVALLEMPYIPSRPDGPQLSLLIILPHQKEGLSELEKNLSAEKFQEWVRLLQNTRMLVTLPKFKALSSFELNDAFKRVGMGLPFTDQADFSGMTGVRGLKIGHILHKIYVSMDETGSEAAAATAIGMNVTSVADPKPPVLFEVDHPFIYIIFEKTTGMILFMGKVMDPNKV